MLITAERSVIFSRYDQLGAPASRLLVPMKDRVAKPDILLKQGINTAAGFLDFNRYRTVRVNFKQGRNGSKLMDTWYINHSGGTFYIYLFASTVTNSLTWVLPKCFSSVVVLSALICSSLNNSGWLALLFP